jgi:hypothetical protein
MKKTNFYFLKLNIKRIWRSCIIITQTAVFVLAVFFISQLALAQGNSSSKSSTMLSSSNEEISIKEAEKGYVGDTSAKPKFIFTSSKLKGNAKGIVEIEGSVENAITVEFFLKPAISVSTPIYLGKGIFDGNTWKYSWDTTKSPDGAYSIVAKIYNSWQAYVGDALEVSIKNSVFSEAKIEEENKKKEQELDIKKKEIREEINNKTEELTYQAKEITSSEQAKKIESETKQKLNEAEQHITQAVENFAVEVKKEQQIKESLEQQKQQKEKLETKIKNIEEELQAINQTKQLTEGIKALEAAKKNDIKSYQEGKTKVEDNLAYSQKELGKVLEKKAEIKAGIIEKNIAPIELIEKSLAKDNKSQVLEVKNEIQKKTEEGLAKIEFEATKKTVGEKKKPLRDFVVERIEIISSAQGDKGLKIEGKGRPDSFINVYIFSNPIVMTTKTDENGNWSILLDKPLSDGSHEVYTVLADSPDEATARSDSFTFTKAGDKVAAITVSSLSAGAAKSPADILSSNSYLLVILIVILSAIIAFIAIGISSRSKVS